MVMVRDVEEKEIQQLKYHTQVVDGKTVKISKEKIFAEVELFLKSRNIENPLSYYEKKADTMNKSLFEILCEVENIMTYKETAQLFSVLTKIPFADKVVGDVFDITPGRYIKSKIGDSIAIYIWHPTALSSMQFSQSDKIYLISRDVFKKTTIQQHEFAEISSSEDDSARNHLYAILKDAVHTAATDVHLVPYPSRNFYRISYRVMGDIIDVGTMDISKGRAIVSVIGNMAKELTPSWKSDETRMPMDGKIEIKAEDLMTSNDVDIRVSVIWKPNMRDGDVVLRLLPKISIENENLKSLGFAADDIHKMTMAATRSRGIILVTGSTGSGKSKTINTLLSSIVRSRNILTVEDPIEYVLSNGRQFQTMEYEAADGKTVAVGFPEFARAFKRHDPDVIFIGEMRDDETVRTAFHLAKTGHLILATLHVSRATMIPEMLVEDYGINIDAVADNLILGVTQTLVKKLCIKCKKPFIFDVVPDWMLNLRYKNVNSEIERFREDKGEDNNLFEPVGCPDCTIQVGGANQVKGFSGRTVVAEVFEFYPEIFNNNQISAIAIEESLKKFFYVSERKNSFKSHRYKNMLTDAVDKVLNGNIDISQIRLLL